MNDLPTIAEGWLEDDQRSTKADKLRAVRDLTAHCPCDRCHAWSTCKVTGHQCSRLRDWVQRGK